MERSSKTIKRTMNRKIWSTMLVAMIALVGLAPVLAGAQNIQSPPGPIIQDLPGVLRIINTAMTWIFTLLIIMAVVFILYAAWLYLSAAGDKGKIETANKILLYAVIAIAVAILARSVPAIVGNFFGQNINP